MRDVPRTIAGASSNPEDTVRFYALRLHEVGMIKINPQKTHRPGHRLAVPQRAEEGVEGVASLGLVR